MKSRLFAPKAMSFPAVMQGYKENPAYCWLKEHAGLEAKFELQTIVGEAETLVKLRTDQILMDHGIQPDPKRQKTENEASASTMAV